MGCCTVVLTAANRRVRSIANIWALSPHSRFYPLSRHFYEWELSDVAQLWNPPSQCSYCQLYLLTLISPTSLRFTSYRPFWQRIYQNPSIPPGHDDVHTPPPFVFISHTSSTFKFSRLAFPASISANGNVVIAAPAPRSQSRNFPDRSSSVRSKVVFSRGQRRQRRRRPTSTPGIDKSDKEDLRVANRVFGLRALWWLRRDERSVFAVPKGKGGGVISKLGRSYLLQTSVVYLYLCLFGEKTKRLV